MSSNSILVVEKSKTQRALLSDYLQSQGLQVISASDGKQAIRSFKKYKPKLVLLNVVLPELNGFEVLRRLKALCPNQSAVVLMSAAGDKVNQVWAKRQGADGYLVKPFHPEQLLAMARKFISNRERDEEKEQGRGSLRLRYSV
ncbi:MAG TPA: two-component system response regulator [Cyanobacteria bacterium UBA8803]|nr:two-component system response regulator [Cyanobacteria bacterium UBA9273]HBL62732.1 two-component system response regulator [Cyanobacteria bacterium UBA8803]